VSLATLEIRSQDVDEFHLHHLQKLFENHLQEIHVYHHLVDLMRIAELLATFASVLVATHLLAHRHTVARNVFPIQSVPQEWLVLEINVRTLVPEVVPHQLSVLW